MLDTTTHRRLTWNEILAGNPIGKAAWDEWEVFEMEPAGEPFPDDWREIGIPLPGTAGALIWLDVEDAVITGDHISARFMSVSLGTAFSVRFRLT